MNFKIYLTFLSLVIFLLYPVQSNSARNAKHKKGVILWNMSDFLNAGASVRLTGNPKLTNPNFANGFTSQ